MDNYEQRILLVNDSRMALLGGRQLLSEAGYKNVDTDEGSNAITMLESNHYDLLIQDLQRPSVDGLELYRWMKTHAPLRNIPILILTISRAVYVDVTKQTTIGKHSFDGTFRVDIEDSRRASQGSDNYLKTPVEFYVEGYLPAECAATSLLASVEAILNKWANFENAEQEFRLRNEILWPVALRALTN